MATAPSKMLRARVQICNEQPFFATLLLQSRMLESKNVKTFTVTRRGNIYFNPDFVESLTVPEGADASELGASAEEIRAFALGGLTRRLQIIGVPLDTL